MFTYVQKVRSTNETNWNGLTDLTQKSADKAITDHPTPADQGHILIKFNPCPATRTPSTPGEQELSPSQLR